LQHEVGGGPGGVRAPQRCDVSRQKNRCSLCGNRMDRENATFEHEDGRGMGGSRQDDRIWKLDPVTRELKPYNSVAHGWCNGKKGSQRMQAFESLSAAKCGVGRKWSKPPKRREDGGRQSEAVSRDHGGGSPGCIPTDRPLCEELARQPGGVQRDFCRCVRSPGNRDVMLRVIEVLRNSLDAEEIRLKTGRSLGAGERLSMLNTKQ
jgi:hypothetical protein